MPDKLVHKNTILLASLFMYQVYCLFIQCLLSAVCACVLYMQVCVCTDRERKKKPSSLSL